MKRTLLLSRFLMLFITEFIWGQAASSKYYYDNLPKSPESSVFTRYGTPTASLYTGSNDINIPLISVKSGDINLKLDINYVSSNGIKVRQEASPFGLGWDVQIPTITQSILGYDDLESFYKLKLSFMYDNTPPFIRNVLTGCEKRVAPYQMVPGKGRQTYFVSLDDHLPVDGYMVNYNTSFSEYDTSPDIFVGNLFGEKVYFATSNFRTVDKAPYNFSPTFESLNKKGYKISYDSTNKFIIADPNGIKYYFGIVSSYGGTGRVTSKEFYITKIIDKNGHVVNFSYDAGNRNVLAIPTFAQRLNYTVYYTQSTVGRVGTVPWPVPFVINGCRMDVPPERFKPLNEPITSPYYGAGKEGSFFVTNPLIDTGYQDILYTLKQIDGDFGSITFHTSSRIDNPSNVKMDQIVLSRYGHVRKQIIFSYDYFTSQSSKTTRNTIATNSSYYQLFYSKLLNDQFSKRLRLNSVIINNTEQFKFKYNSTPLPDKDSFAIDYWGYFNGAVNNKSLFANPNDLALGVPVNPDYNGNEKTASESYAKAGILEEITYPTGGYTRFQYELNEANNLFTVSSKVGKGHGLRIKRIVNYDSNGGVLGTRFFAYNNGITINPLNLIKRFAFSVAPSFYQINRTSVISTLATSDTDISPLSSGDILGYSVVTYYDEDQNGQTNGKTVTEFANNIDQRFTLRSDDLPIYIPTIRDPNTPDNGTILSRTDYNGNGAIVKKVLMTYSIIFPSTFLYGSDVLLNQDLGYYYDGSTSILQSRPFAYFSFYPIYLKRQVLLQRIEQDMFMHGDIAQTVDYSYDTNDFLKSRITHFQDGKINTESFTYTSSLTPFVSRNILHNLINHQIVGDNSSVILNETTGYDPTGGIVNPLDVKKQNVTAAVPPNIIVTYDKYDPTNGNLLQYSDKGRIPTALIWGYNNSQIIAKIEGATYNAVSQLATTIISDSNEDDSQDSDDSEVKLRISLSSFRNLAALNGCQITTYTYDPLIGVRSITPPSGITEFYEYDAAGRLKSVKDVNGNILKDYQYHYKP